MSTSGKVIFLNLYLVCTDTLKLSVLMFSPVNNKAKYLFAMFKNVKSRSLEKEVNF